MATEWDALQLAICTTVEDNVNWGPPKIPIHYACIEVKDNVTSRIETVGYWRRCDDVGSSTLGTTNPKVAQGCMAERRPAGHSWHDSCV